MAEYQSISHAKYDIKYQSTEPGTLESSAISEGTKFEVVAGGIFAIEEEVLGTASLGSRIFLCDTTVGSVTEEMIREYIERHRETGSQITVDGEF